MSSVHVSRRQLLSGLAGAYLLSAARAQERSPPGPNDWHLGPFRRVRAEPILGPDAHPVFYCPMRKKAINWLSGHSFNPASIAKDGRLWLLFRAEDTTGSKEIGGHTSRLGLAWSDDGIRFNVLPAPVLFPGEDDQKAAEWDGGCEDPRLCESQDGTYIATYTQWNHRNTLLGIASSRDLVTWTKHGQAFAGTAYEGMHTKSASIIQVVDGGRMKAAKINGKYWMVFGEGTVHLAQSVDLIRWQPVENSPGELGVLLSPRPFRFDSKLVEVGPPPLLTSKGIVMLYNGKNSGDDQQRDPAIGAGAYSGGQALLHPADPLRVLARDETPFIQPELPWERNGQYVAGTTFIEGLTYFRGRLHLYYGSADTYVGLAASDPISAF